MRRRWVLAVIGASALALVALVIVYPQAMIGPGPLADGHHEFANNCFACHSVWRGADSRRCVECHVLADIGLRTTKGVMLPQRNMKASFHQGLIERDCLACHGGHVGSILKQRSRMKFSHTLLHAAIRQRCEVCHIPPSDGLHRQVKGGCHQCHSQVHWKPANFNHDEFFVLDRSHNAACVICHVNEGYSQYTCYGCHEHTPAKMRAQHLQEGISNFENCIDCHRSADGE